VNFPLLTVTPQLILRLGRRQGRLRHRLPCFGGRHALISLDRLSLVGFAAEASPTMAPSASCCLVASASALAFSYVARTASAV
jgi:hypothetical protein